MSHLHKCLGILNEKQPWLFINDITDMEVLLIARDLKAYADKQEKVAYNGI